MKAKYSRKLTLSEHRKMWNWIADTTKAKNEVTTKLEYFDQSHLNYEDLTAGCYCCEYAAKKHHQEHKEVVNRFICVYCPLIWHGGPMIELEPTIEFSPCLDYESPFAKFNEAVSKGNIEDCIKYSREIASLPEAREDE